VKFRFWHAKKNLTRERDPVTAGMQIQDADSTGASGGDHVHWSMKFVDENGSTMDQDNGYYGAVDFTDWYENTFILKALKPEIGEPVVEKNTLIQLAFAMERIGYYRLAQVIRLFITTFGMR
jgi:murein DD-endopeptidase MepM/ murein hydrolase activator NlpD